MSNKKIYLASPTMHGEEQDYIKEAFDTNWIAPLGKNVDQFEIETAAYAKVPYCVALSSGTAALHLAVRMLGLKDGDTVLSSALTFAASCNPAAYERTNIVFVDSEPDTWNISPEALKRALKDHPEAKALIYVHLYGTPAKVDEIREICTAHGVAMIEDAAESLGATYKGRHTGAFGDYGVYSFNGNKIITTSGGGLLVTHSKEAADRARFLATQAREPYPWYQHEEIGYNYRMSNIIAGIGRGQLKHIDEHIALKKAIYQTYKEAFADLPVHMNPYEEGTAEPNYWLSCMTIDPECSVSPMDLIEAMAAENIECRPIWKPMQLQPVYAHCEFYPHDPDAELSVSEDIFNRGICLPSDIKNTKEDMDRIISVVRSKFA